MATNSENLATALTALYGQLALYEAATDLDRMERIQSLIEDLERLQASGAVAGADSGPIEDEVHGIV
jgi:hypothetical protein